MTDFVRSFSDEDIRSKFTDDIYWCSIANSRRLTLHSYPAQSHFRVYAIFLVEVNGKVQLIEGANSEQGYIGGAICAERSAIVKFRFLDNYKVLKLIISTDSHLPIYPGVLCREYLCSVCGKEVPVVLENCNGDHMLICKVGELYPYPLIYRHQTRYTLLPFAEEFSRIMSTDCNESARMVRSKAIEAIRFDAKDDIHPLRLAAAVLFDNGEVEVAWQMKGMEYGCTLDPISQLVREMEKRKVVNPALSGSAAVNPVIITMVDQLGVSHGPVAMARSLLTEYGYENLLVVVHDFDSGMIHEVKADQLVPHPGGGRSVCGSDFVPAEES